MALPRFIEIDGRRYLWRDLVALRHAQATPAEQQPTLFSCAKINDRDRARVPQLPPLAGTAVVPSPAI
jgi:hypothetical protein